MNEDNNIPIFDESLIIGYFCGESTLEEQAALLSWINSSDENLDTYLKMKQLWALRQVDHYASDFELKRALASLERKIETNKQRNRRIVIRRIGRFAAMALILLGGILVYYITSKPAAEQWITIQVADRELVREVTLPDSTKVWLNKYTSISYPGTFKHRLVKISGEAFFEVRKDADRPFKVETSAIQVHVTGTMFNIKDRPDDGIIQTTLTDGKVALYDGDVLLASLVPGQQATYDRYQHQIHVQNVKTDLYTSWRTGLMMFDKAYLADILKELEIVYDVRIIYNTRQTTQKQYNFVFRNNQPIETVLEMLQFVAPISYKKNENEIYINEI